MTFDGVTFKPENDEKRLTTQLKRVFNALKDSEWYTLNELEALTGDPAASISAQLRNLRKTRFGAFKVERRHRGNDESNGLFEYRVLPGQTGNMRFFEPLPKSNKSQAVERVTKQELLDMGKRIGLTHWMQETALWHDYCQLIERLQIPN